MPEATDYKQAAIEQWTADPCGANTVGGEPGSAQYFKRLLAARDDYAPWMADALDYAGACGLDVLDVGCGQGIDLYQYARAGARATGVDLTPRHVELARAHLEAMGLGAEVVGGDAEHLPFDDATFHRASSNGVLHHTPDMPAALREVRRVLVPGGEARIVVYNRNSLHYWLTQVLLNGIGRGWLFRERSMAGVLSRGVEYSSVDARPLVRVYTARQLRSLMADAGFSDVGVTIRHFRAVDTPLTYPLRRLRLLQEPVVLDRIGRVGGWYIVAKGTATAEVRP